MDKTMEMTLSRSSFEAVRMSVATDRSFDTVKAALLSQMGRLKGDEIPKILAAAKGREDFEREINKLAGDSGFMLFFEVDHSRYLPLYGIKRRATRLIFGNPAIAATMTQHDISAALFAPVELLLYEADDGAGSTIIYDLPSVLMQAQKDPALFGSATALDAKMETLVRRATA
ncbi:MAG: DUF302 domain-containing protein [Methylovirgula sp.]